MTYTTTYDETDCCYRTHHTSPCGQWRVTLSVCKYGHNDPYADRYYAMHLTPEGWRRLGKEHFKQSAAFRSLEVWIARAARQATRAAREQEKAARKAERQRARRNRAAKRQRAARRKGRRGQQLLLNV